MSGSFGNYCVSGVTQKWLPTFWEYFMIKDLADSLSGITLSPFFFINQISTLKQTLDNYPFWKCSPAWQPKQLTSMQGPISNPPISSPIPTGCHVSLIPLRWVNLGWWWNSSCTQRKSCTIDYLYWLRKASEVENQAEEWISSIKPFWENPRRGQDPLARAQGREPEAGAAWRLTDIWSFK